MYGFELNSVSAGYDGKAVLHDVTLTVRQGELLALIGPNGAGKTTLARLMYRAIKPTAGRATLDGIDVWKYRTKDFARRVAHVGQSERIVWPFTVGQIVEMGRFAHRGWIAPYTPGDRTIVDEALGITGLLDLKERQINTLSGGEIQRALLARAIAQQPRFFIFDEPVNHLDIKYQIDVLDTARSLVDAGLGVIVCLHDLSLTGLYADRVALVANGEIRIQGAPEQVLVKEIIEEVYRSPVHIDTYPGTNKIFVMPVPNLAAKREREEAET
jgi:iron complex transport system ATP-binding protein